MLAITGKGLSGEKTLVSLLQDQASVCNGKSGTTRLPVREANNATYYDAKGACSTDNGSYVAAYSVVEGADYVIMLVELLAQDDSSNPVLERQPEIDDGVLAKFNPR